jgi:segregation and condensation protein B
MDNLKGILESLLFVAETPLTIERIRQIIPEVPSQRIKEALETLREEYDARQGAIHLREVAGGYQLRTRSQYHQWIKQYLKPNPKKLSKAALESLAIIAYKQPITRHEVEHIRGVDSGGVLRMLFERKFIRVLGRKEVPGRPLLYATTKHFLEAFALKDLSELPSPKEIESYGRSDTEPGAADAQKDSEESIGEQDVLQDTQQHPQKDAADT